MYYDVATIGQFTVNRVVRFDPYAGTAPPPPGTSNNEYDKVGHVTGFTLNELGEILILVKWASAKESRLHPTRLVAL